ncbi:hypothetical protein DFH09DRAFT_1094492 [Mycena vulgaris]|nr:hypothetical protein DFH09DRAFT_1094492 [Mycena vulgaris]
MRERLPAAVTSTSSSCWERRSADPPTSDARPVRVCTHRYSWGAKERQLKTFQQERAWLRRNGVDKTCVRQAAAFPAATRHEAMHRRNFFERGIALSADSNPTRFMPPLLLHPKSPHTGTRENCLEVVRARYRLFRASYLARATIVVVVKGKGDNSA